MKINRLLTIFPMLLLAFLLAFSGLVFAQDEEKVDETEEEAKPNCQLLLAKSTCWVDRELTLRVIDALTFEHRQTIKLGKEDMGLKQALTCDKFDQLTFQVNFLPSVWEREEDRWYQAKRIWNVPGDLDPGEEWLVRLCFPDDFMRVPMLPTGDLTDCVCDFSLIAD